MPEIKISRIKKCRQASEKDIILQREVSFDIPPIMALRLKKIPSLYLVLAFFLVRSPRGCISFQQDEGRP